jgi:hypothetical protein
MNMVLSTLMKIESLYHIVQNGPGKNRKLAMLRSAGGILTRAAASPSERLLRHTEASVKWAKNWSLIPLKKSKVLTVDICKSST